MLLAESGVLGQSGFPDRPVAPADVPPMGEVARPSLAQRALPAAPGLQRRVRWPGQVPPTDRYGGEAEYHARAKGTAGSQSISRGNPSYRRFVEWTA